MNNANEPKDPLLIDHEVDGIQELDNLLPCWWVWLFYATIAFSVVYMAYYHVLEAGDLQAVEFAKEWKKGEEIKSAAIAKFESGLGSLQPSAEPAILAAGQQTFTTLCAPCHRADGGGVVGPNLCDDYWIHGSSYLDTLKVIINGQPEKGMLSWRSLLKPSEIQAVASFIYTFRGTKPPNPKPREDQTAPEKPSEFE